MVEGMPVVAWVGLWMSCHAFIQGSEVRTEWPDGGSLLMQPAITVAMFSLVSGEMAKEMEASRNSA